MSEIETPKTWELIDENDEEALFRTFSADAGQLDVSIEKGEEDFKTSLKQVVDGEYRTLATKHFRMKSKAYVEAFDYMEQENQRRENFETILSEQQKDVDIRNVDVGQKEPFILIKTDKMIYTYDIVECDCARCQDPDDPEGPSGYPANPRAITTPENGEFEKSLSDDKFQVPTPVLDRAEEASGYYCGPFVEE